MIEVTDTQQTATEAGGPLALAFDIPLSATADEAAQLINEPCERGYYISAILQWPGAGARVFLRRYNKPPVKSEGPTPVKETREARAIQYLRDNREMSAPQLFAAFKAIGFPRSQAWIRAKRVEVIRADRRVS